MKFAHLVLCTVLALGASHAFALDVGQPAPCVILDDIQTDGSIINECIRTQNPGTTHTLIEFFSVTCSDCQANLPKVSQLNSMISGTTTVRLVSIDRNADDVKQYIATNKSLINFPVALDINRSALKAYGVDVTPTVFILDSNLNVIYKHEGVFADQDLLDIQGLVK